MEFPEGIAGVRMQWRTRQEGSLAAVDHAVTLVEDYWRVNGYFTVSEYPVVEARRYGGFRIAPDLDILAFHFPGAGRLVPSESHENEFSYVSDPELGRRLCAEMRIGEVKKGEAGLTEAAIDPAVLQAALHALVAAIVAKLQKLSSSCCRRGPLMTNCGHRVPLVAFGASLGSSGSPKCDIVSLGHIQRFLGDYICEHWEVLHQAQFKYPVSGFLMMLEKGHRGHIPAQERV